MRRQIHVFVLALGVLVVGGLVAGACFNPRALAPGEAGLHCHELDEPACPSGQMCVSGRCVRAGGGTVLDGGTRDMAMSGADMSGGPVDMAMGGMGTRAQGCNTARKCAIACTTAACLDNCYFAADTTGQTLFDDALACGQQHCITAQHCTVSGTTLVDGILGGCDACLDNALAGFTETSCVGTQNCNPSQCVPKYNACKAD